MLRGCSGRDMSNQTGLKHVPTEPAQLESKRSRRRAGGRAAALRRAPSDSDCSGETASLSADSAERAPRAPPPPTRQAKSRSSRRRGSEWEVLEGLKDGQRFEKRPEVFNGYLHKKRKWPLKGWHKRFFVVDGGILVYARSPSDVARGRLHGSVDVGLSVISAKARRRRIDIDADEFIYHLRAKTPEAFRTWLNVLKTHRLYRQHLLTFGARESVPKIHAPLEDLPPPETTSQSLSRTESWYLNPIEGGQIDSRSTWDSSILRPSSLKTLLPNPPLKKWPRTYLNANEIPTLSDKSSTKNEVLVINKQPYKNRSLCSMNCLAKARETTRKYDANRNIENVSQKKKSKGEIQVHSTNLDLGLDSTCLETKQKTSQHVERKNIEQIYVKQTERDSEEARRNKIQHNSEKDNAVVTQTDPVVYCFTHKPRSHSTNTEQPLLKRSKKSTNMVKYRNSNMEPTLKKPFSKCMLLGKYKLKVSRQSDAKLARTDYATKPDLKEQMKFETIAIENEENGAEVYRMTDKLIETVFENYRRSDKRSCEENLKSFIDQVITELYCFSCEHSDDHPVKALFKCLLEYWIRTASLESLNGKIPLSSQVKLLEKPSNARFTRDQNTSSLCVQNISKETQFEGHTLGLTKKKTQNSVKTFGRRMPGGQVGVMNTDKDQRVQELERMLNNTVYYCDNINRTGTEEDFRTTKKPLKKNCKKSFKIAPSYHKLCNRKNTCESTEIEKALNDFIKDSSLPPDMSSDVFNILKILNNSKNYRCSSPHSSKAGKRNSCKRAAIANRVVNKTSKCIMTQVSMKINRLESEGNLTDYGQIYLNDVLSKICIEPNIECTYPKSKSNSNRTKDTIHEFRRVLEEKQETPQLSNSKENANSKKNNFLVYLSKYNLDRMSLAEGPTSRNLMSVACRIEKKSSNQNISRQFMDTDQGRNLYGRAHNIWQTNVEYMCDSDEIFKSAFRPPCISNMPNSFLKSHLEAQSEKFNMTQLFSSSGTSKRYPNECYDKYRLLTQDNDRICQEGKSTTVLCGSRSKVFPTNEVTSYNVYVKNFDKSSRLISNATFERSEQIPPRKPFPANFNENSIILLIDRLSTLTECIPFLHRDINRLYRGLYKELGPAYDECKFIDDTIKDRLRKDVSTECRDLGHFTIFNRADAVTNTISFMTLLKSIARAYNKLQHKMNHVNLQAAVESYIELSENSNRSHKAIPNQNSYRLLCTRDFATNTATKPKELKSGNRTCVPVTLKKKSPIRKGKVCFIKNRRYINIIKDIPILPLQISKSNVLNKSAMFKDNLNECNVYELFVSNRFRTNCSDSMIESRAKLKSSDSGGPLENASRELGQAQLSVQQLQRLLDALEMQQVHHDTDVSIEGASPNVKKDRRKFGLRKKKSNSKCASVELQPPHLDPSNSHMALSALTAPPSPGGGASSIPNSAASLPIACAATRPQSLPGAEALGGTGGTSLASLTPDHQLREDFAVLAKDLVASLKGVVSTLVCERGRLRAAAEAGEAAGGPTLAALRSNLSTALHQNSELRSRLSRIHDASDLAEISSMGPSEQNRQFQQSLSYSSSCVSASEFFDAEEHEEDLKPAEMLNADEAGVIELDGDSSSEAGSLSSEEGSASSDNSEAAMVTAEPVSLHITANGSAEAATEVGMPPGRLQKRGSWSSRSQTGGWARRTRLPSARPTPGGPSLWNLLYKNIGKDLSQISMPVTINEPLNMLQRLCEELEYSELLDAACACNNAAERMALIAAFAVSAYAASAHRAASKPFNPLLAETYECVRADRGFRFIAEQVSHHPPISACHAESAQWAFWQEARIRTKFWGKSMEFQPAGRVHVRLKPSGDHYSWNKVTTCVHNLFGGQRWVDQYGDMHLTCHGTDVTCKLNFVKASSWSSSRHEVRGGVSWGGGRLRLAGRWSEALSAGDPPAARCLWRPGAMPPEHELYYGFTRFAMELNELEPGMKDVLPYTDTRLRPDQRALEEGDVESAERLKRELEQAQRERRRDASEHTPAWFRKAVEGGEEMWVFTGEYWRAREGGFRDLSAPRIW